MTHHCANCQALREQVVNLERQMGLSFPKGAMGALTETLGLSPNQCRLLLTIYYHGDWTHSRYLERHLDMNDAVLKVSIYRIRQRLGRAFLDSHWGIGYRLPDAARARVQEVLG